jgi:hypothetical protein
MNEIRTTLLAVIPLTNDAIHIYIGMLCLLATCLLFRRSLTWWPALIPGFVVSVLIEIFDAVQGSHWTWSLKDIVNTNLWPVVLVLLADRLGTTRSRTSPRPPTSVPQSDAK